MTRTSRLVPASPCCFSTTGIRSPPDLPNNSPQREPSFKTLDLPRTSWTNAGTDAPVVAGDTYHASASCWVICRRSEEHTSESSHQIISYAVFCLKKKISYRELAYLVHLCEHRL